MWRFIRALFRELVSLWKEVESYALILILILLVIFAALYIRGVLNNIVNPPFPIFGGPL